MRQVVLTIAGSDSGGGAGIQADLKTFCAFGVFGASAVTALTAQNTLGVRAIADVEASFVKAQIEAVAEDFAIAAAKTGMLARQSVIETVAESLRALALAHLVVDPVSVAAGGDVLLEPAAISAMRELMLPLAAVITPNAREAEIITGTAVTDLRTMRAAAEKLVVMGARAALVKGGRLGGDESIDVLCDGRSTREYRAQRVAIRRTHGAGCTLSAALAASLALGLDLDTAVDVAKSYASTALETAVNIGHGATPLNHMVNPERMIKLKVCGTRQP
jgi:hydroxymethylpyrimidine/phosphomethylpyrimidine kinase